MFQSVIDQNEWSTRRLGTGAGVSLLVHTALIAGVLIISAKVVKKVEPETRIVQYMQLPRRGTPTPPAATKSVVEPPKPQHKRPKTLVQPTTIPQKPPPEVEPTTQKQEDPPPDLPYDPQGTPDGITDAVGCVACKAIEGLTPAPAEPTGDAPTTFVYGTMTPPDFISGAKIQYTREALEAHVTGLLIAKCIITREGDVQNCRIIKGQPYMDDAVLSALETRRYTPVTYQGHPISVSYIFKINLNMPR